jgi:hypothetical protein
MMVELRLTGRQTAVANSIHPDDKDRYVWHVGQLAEIHAGELTRRVRLVAVSSLILRYSQPKGTDAPTTASPLPATYCGATA